MINNHAFFEHILEQHPHRENFAAFIAACERPLRKSIRVNTLKISVHDFLSLADNHSWLLSPIPWCKEGFWVTHEDQNALLQLGNCSEHLMGLFYIQEASSMLPAVALLAGSADAKATPLILDLAASPGSKTTQLAALMNNKGTILANELSASRLKVLHANLQRSGVTNSCLSHCDGRVMHNSLSAVFDAILVDAPCGGEGTYRKDPKALDNWSIAAIETISALQKQLISSAWKMLKPGGRLVYSTCTLSRAENHEVINWLASEVGSELEIIDLGKLFPEAQRVITEEGYLHIWPEIFDCEGFFVACIEKKSSAATSTAFKESSQSPFKSPDKKIVQIVQQYYQQQFGFDLLPLLPGLKIRNSHHQQQIWLFPEFAEQLRDALHLQRSGIRICDLIESRNGLLIKTCHELVTCFGDQFKRQFIELTSAEASACSKGENITIGFSNELQKGEVVMRYQGYSLGLAKLLIPNKNKKILKNNLPRDLLRNNVVF